LGKINTSIIGKTHKNFSFQNILVENEISILPSIIKDISVACNIHKGSNPNLTNQFDVNHRSRTVIQNSETTIFQTKLHNIYHEFSSLIEYIDKLSLCNREED